MFAFVLKNDELIMAMRTACRSARDILSGVMNNLYSIRFHYLTNHLRFRELIDGKQQTCRR